MDHVLKKLLNVPQAIFSGALHGLEQETLRVDKQGNIAQDRHPIEFGSALMNPCLTTDFSEAQIEFTTAAYTSIPAVLNELELLSAFAQQTIAPTYEELLWPSSMPARLPKNENDINLAYYGNSLYSQQKHIYRKGLAYRYGRRMQTISGVHYNFSLSEAFWEAYFELAPASLWNKTGATEQARRSTTYLSLLRNFLRNVYILPYLFGSSPVLDESLFATPSTPNICCAKLLDVKEQQLQKLHNRQHTFYNPYATALRQSQLGYNHPSQWCLRVRYNELDEYLQDMCHAIGETNPEWAKGVQANGKQLNTNYLQIENEHYTPIRPKRNFNPQHERLLTAIENRGIEYLELRCLDLQFQSNTFTGIDASTLCFMQMLLYHCLLSPSPLLECAEEIEGRTNYLLSVWSGRNPDCSIHTNGQTKKLRQAGLDLCEELDVYAERLDNEYKSHIYRQSLEIQRNKLYNIDSIPAAQIMQKFEEEPSMEFVDYGLMLANEQQKTALMYEISKEQKKRLSNLVQTSLEQQQELENKNEPAPNLKHLPKIC